MTTSTRAILDLDARSELTGSILALDAVNEALRLALSEEQDARFKIILNIIRFELLPQCPQEISDSVIWTSVDRNLQRILDTNQMDYC